MSSHRTGKYLIQKMSMHLQEDYWWQFFASDGPFTCRSVFYPTIEECLDSLYFARNGVYTWDVEPTASGYVAVLSDEVGREVASSRTYNTESAARHFIREAQDYFASVEGYPQNMTGDQPGNG